MSEQQLEVVRFMDDYVCKELCVNFDTEHCPWTPEGVKPELVSAGERIELEDKKEWRKACYKFSCKRIGIMRDELEGGVRCGQHCPVWFVCNMFKERILVTYQDYLLMKEKCNCV